MKVGDKIVLKNISHILVNGTIVIIINIENNKIWFNMNFIEGLVFVEADSNYYRLATKLDEVLR
jgi:hypothetical protein